MDTDSNSYFAALFGEHSEEIAQIVTNAFKRSYDENIGCYDEALGHTPLVYGFMVRSTGIMYLAEAFGRFEGASIIQSGNIFHVRFEGGRMMHFYKYPDMETAKFDRSQVRRQLVSDNQQLSLFSDSFGRLTPVEVARSAKHLVVVHQGDPHSGLRSIDVGVPINQLSDGSQWLWRDNLYRAPITAPVKLDAMPPSVLTYTDMPVPELSLDHSSDSQKDAEAAEEEPS